MTSSSPKRATLPEGVDPLEALRRLQRQLAGAHAVQRPGTVDRSVTSYEEGGKDAERAAGMNLAPIVGAVEALVAALRRQAQELDPLAVPSRYGSVWVCPVGECRWSHREENAVSSTDTEVAERVRTAVTEHLHDHVVKAPLAVVDALAAQVFDWPAHCSEWIAGSDPESPDQCPEYASPGSDKCPLHEPGQVEYTAELMVRQGWLSPSQAAELRTDERRRAGLMNGGHPDAKPRGCVAYPPLGTEWRYGFPPKGTTTMWRCQRCGTNHQGGPPRCLHCGHTVLDPGHWVALPPEGTTT